MKYCDNCQLQLDDYYEKCWKCDGEITSTTALTAEEEKEKANSNTISNSNSISKFLLGLGYVVMILGVVGSFILAVAGYGINWIVLISGVLASCTSGGIILGLGEVIYKLHMIEVNTSIKINE